MLRQDVVSRLLILIAVCLTILLYVFVGVEPLITPILLLFGAGVIRIFVTVKKVQVDETIDETEKHDIIYYSMIGLLAMLVGGIFIEKLYHPPVPSRISDISMLPYVAVLFSALMAISEEIFFRGELFGFVATAGARTKVPGAISGAILLTALAFRYYHLKVYAGSEEDLLYVLLGGIVLASVAWKTKRVLTPTIAHILNNLGGTIFLVPALVIIGLWSITKIRRGRITWEM